ncbi:hypothetical protein HDU93_002523, partial [Gonapodya sp. JEL0774]
PSAVLFELFDDLLLLGNGGQTLYFGEIGPNSKTAISYFEKRGAAPHNQSENPADYILDAGNGLRNADPEIAIDWVSQWRKSDEAEFLETRISELRNVPVDEALQKMQEQEFNITITQQIPIVMKRLFTLFWRSPRYTVGQVIVSIVEAAFIAVSFFQIPKTQAGLLQRAFAIMLAGAYSGRTASQTIPFFFDLKTNFLRESAQGFYSSVAFSTAITVVEIPYNILQSTILFAIMYFSVGLSGVPSVAAIFWTFHVILTVFANSLGQAVAALMPNMPLAFLLVAVSNLFLAALAGIGGPEKQMPAFWKGVFYMNPLREFTMVFLVLRSVLTPSTTDYFIEGALVNEFEDLKITCQDSELLLFPPPPGLTCGQYMNPYFANGGSGYLDNPTARDMCGCVAEYGSEVDPGSNLIPFCPITRITVFAS